MFGYIVANVDDLDDAEKARYRAVYCGLCRTLKERGGQRSRVFLTYDLTFLAMLYNSLYEPAEDTGTFRCPFHPGGKQAYVATPYTGYAADLSIALAYHKCLDDWRDDRSVRARAYAAFIEKAYRGAWGRIPWQCAAIERAFDEMNHLEHAPDASPDAVGNRFGRLLGDVMAHGHGVWEDALFAMGNALGRFIYLMDAAVDFEDDKKSGSYNPLVAMGSTPEGARDALVHLIGSTVAAFERLPLEQDVHIMRSVLYDGVWNAFEVHYGEGNGKGKGKGASRRTANASADGVGAGCPADRAENAARAVADDTATDARD